MKTCFTFAFDHLPAPAVPLIHHKPVVLQRHHLTDAKARRQPKATSPLIRPSACRSPPSAAPAPPLNLRRILDRRGLQDLTSAVHPASPLGLPCPCSTLVPCCSPPAPHPVGFGTPTKCCPEPDMFALASGSGAEKGHIRPVVTGMQQTSHLASPDALRIQPRIVHSLLNPVRT